MAYLFRYEFLDGKIMTYDFPPAHLATSVNQERHILSLDSEEAISRLREMLNSLCAKTWASERECSQALMRVASGG
ncbi:MAG: hypothetical protein ACRD3E_05385 [Terriglobales bacterium]